MTSPEPDDARRRATELYDDDAMREILRLASIDSVRPREPASLGDGLTARDIVQIAEEVGIPQESAWSAIEQFRRGRSDDRHRLLITRRLRGRVSAEGFDSLALSMRARHGWDSRPDVGRQRLTLQFPCISGPRTVSVVNDDEHVVIEVGQHFLPDLAIQGAKVGLIAAAMAVPLLLQAPTLPSAAALAALPLGAGVAWAWPRVTRFVLRRRAVARLETLADEIEAGVRDEAGAGK